MGEKILECEEKIMVDLDVVKTAIEEKIDHFILNELMEAVGECLNGVHFTLMFDDEEDDDD